MYLTCTQTDSDEYKRKIKLRRSGLSFNGDSIQERGRQSLLQVCFPCLVTGCATLAPISNMRINPSTSRSLYLISMFLNSPNAILRLLYQFFLAVFSLRANWAHPAPLSDSYFSMSCLSFSPSSP
ncbi:hypothetical protein P692DRAFT_20916729 [Suillus brevipes Sb2]|nr:hypothetical protein P692DRAFT_20916729 [Suillus brevipes Sb2]